MQADNTNEKGTGALGLIQDTLNFESILSLQLVTPISEHCCGRGIQALPH